LIKPLTKGINKGKLVGWTDINEGKKCKDAKKIDEIRKVADSYEKLLKVK